MLQIKIGNSTSVISGLTADQHRSLVKVLSYLTGSEQTYFSGAYRQRRIPLIDKKGAFPTGLLYIVFAWIFENGLSKEADIDDTRIVPKLRPGLFHGDKLPKPHKWQDRASEDCVEAQRGIVSACTGSGKSILAAWIVYRLQVPTLIVVPGVELCRQLRETMTEIFGADRVGGLGSALAIENIDALDPNKPLKGYDCVIVDEFHHSAAKSYRDLNKKAWTGVFHRFGLSATPWRTDDNERLLLESFLAQVIYEYPYSKAVENGHIVPIEPYLVKLSHTPIDAYTYAEAYNQLIINKYERTQAICDLAKMLYDSKASTLILVDQIAHGQIIQEALEEMGYDIPFANGRDQEEGKEFIRMFNAKEFPVLIGSSILGEGIDSKPCEWVILAGGTGKSKTQLMQRVGRAVRKYGDKETAKIVTFYEPSHKWFKKHHSAFLKVMREEYKVKPAILSIDFIKE